MSLTIHPSQAYALLAGLYIGKFTNLFSDVVITGLVLYIVTPEIFTEDRLTRAKKYFWSWFRYNQTHIDLSMLTNEQKIKLGLLKSIKQNIELQPKLEYNLLHDLSKLPKIEIVQSPYPNEI